MLTLLLKSQLSAEDSDVIQSPSIVAHCAPLAVKKYFDSAFVRIRSTSKPNITLWQYKMYNDNNIETNIFTLPLYRYDTKATWATVMYFPINKYSLPRDQ